MWDCIYSYMNKFAKKILWTFERNGDVLCPCKDKLAIWLKQCLFLKKKWKLSWSGILIMFYWATVSFIGVLPINNLWAFKEMTNCILLIQVVAICNWHIAKVELIIWLIEICLNYGVSCWVVSVFLEIILFYFINCLFHSSGAHLQFNIDSPSPFLLLMPHSLLLPTVLCLCV